MNDHLKCSIRRLSGLGKSVPLAFAAFLVDLFVLRSIRKSRTVEKIKKSPQQGQRRREGERVFGMGTPG
jgi:hypothetical protein